MLDGADFVSVAAEVANLDRPVEEQNHAAEEVGDCLLCRKGYGETADTETGEQWNEIAPRS